MHVEESMVRLNHVKGYVMVFLMYAMDVCLPQDDDGKICIQVLKIFPPDPFVRYSPHGCIVFRGLLFGVASHHGL